MRPGSLVGAFGSAWLAVVAAAGAGEVLADTLTVTPIAVSRQTAPVGGRYVLFGDVSLDSLRTVTFTASLSRGQVGLFRASRGQVVPLVLTGDEAPPDAGVLFDVPIEGAGNAAGDLAFIATTRLPSRAGVFLRRGGVTTTVARSGDTAPTRAPYLFHAFDQIYLLDTGDLYFGATLADPSAPSAAVRRAIFRADPGGLDAVVEPGDRFGGTREIEDALQFDVNEDGDVVLLAGITDAELIQPETTVLEIVRAAGGRLSTLASVNLSISGGVDLVRALAFTFDQVHVDASGAASFYASTGDFPRGAYYRNDTGRLLANARILGQGDPSPVSSKDRLVDLIGFGLNRSGTLAFHATTKERPAGGLFVRRAGATLPVAIAGETRPDGLDVWHGFLRVALNDRDAFVFTDLQDLSVQVGVFLARFVPSAAETIALLRDLIGSDGVDPGVAANVRAVLDVIERFLARDEKVAAARMTDALRLELNARAGRSIPTELAGEIDLLLEDLLEVLGGSAPHGPAGTRPSGRQRMAR